MSSSVVILNGLNNNIGIYTSAVAIKRGQIVRIDSNSQLQLASCENGSANQELLGVCMNEVDATGLSDLERVLNIPKDTMKVDRDYVSVYGGDGVIEISSSASDDLLDNSDGNVADSANIGLENLTIKSGKWKKAVAGDVIKGSVQAVDSDASTVTIKILYSNLKTA